MTQEVSKPAGPQSLDMGILLGQNQAFGLIAGRCSAAQAVAIRRLRSEKLYRSVTPKWSDFCATHLKMSKRNADQIISLLEEFGPGYFEVAHITRISPETYRALQPSIRDGALHHDGQAIALIEANAQQLATAVAKVRRAKAPQTPDPLLERIATLDRRCAAILDEFQAIVNQRHRMHAPLLSVTLQSLQRQLERVSRSI
jgi:hypothetical protein